jgi:hypothetical protein
VIARAFEEERGLLPSDGQNKGCSKRQLKQEIKVRDDYLLDTRRTNER